MTADLALIASDPSVAEQSADPGQYVVLACERAKEWLAHALDGAHIEEIVEVKSQAEAIRVYTTQKQLGKDAELSAAEVVRRAERGIGLAIRKGQEAGEIATSHEAKVYAGKVRQQKDENSLLERPVLASDYVPQSDLSGNSAGIWHVTDGVSDEVFEDAITEAKVEGNLSRANVVRKTRGKSESTRQSRFEKSQMIRTLAAEGHTSAQIADRMGYGTRGGEVVRDIAREYSIPIPADAITRKRRQIDSTRVARQTVFALEGAAAGLELIDYADIDPEEVADWATSLTESMRALNRFVRKIKEMDQ